ncbi:MAG: hypothetical protein ACPLPR_02410 [Bacillota bacterium]
MSVVRFLSEGGWRVVSVDYPQSGCGLALRPADCRDKNRGKLIPDVIAVRRNIVMVVESNTKCTRKDIANLAKAKSEAYLGAIAEVAAVQKDLLLVKTALAVGAAIRLSDPWFARLQNAAIDLLIRVHPNGACAVEFLRSGKLPPPSLWPTEDT